MLLHYFPLDDFRIVSLSRYFPTGISRFLRGEIEARGSAGSQNQPPELVTGVRDPAWAPRQFMLVGPANDRVEARAMRPPRMEDNVELVVTLAKVRGCPRVQGLRSHEVSLTPPCVPCSTTFLPPHLRVSLAAPRSFLHRTLTLIHPGSRVRQ